MSILPHGEDIRKAVKWISDMQLSDANADPNKLVEQACLKFNLSPIDAQYLSRWVKGEGG